MSTILNREYDWDCEHEVGTHLQDLVALGSLIESAAHDPEDGLTEDEWVRIGWLIHRTARKGLVAYLQEHKPKVVQSGGAK